MKIEYVDELMEYLKAKLNSGELSPGSELTVYNSAEKIYEVPDLEIDDLGDLNIGVTDYAT